MVSTDQSKTVHFSEEKVVRSHTKKAAAATTSTQKAAKSPKASSTEVELLVQSWQHLEQHCSVVWNKVFSPSHPSHALRSPSPTDDSSSPVTPNSRRMTELSNSSASRGTPLRQPFVASDALQHPTLTPSKLPPLATASAPLLPIKYFFLLCLLLSSALVCLLYHTSSPLLMSIQQVYSEYRSLSYYSLDYYHAYFATPPQVSSKSSRLSSTILRPSMTQVNLTNSIVVFGDTSNTDVLVWDIRGYDLQHPPALSLAVVEAELKSLLSSTSGGDSSKTNTSADSVTLAKKDCIEIKVQLIHGMSSEDYLPSKQQSPQIVILPSNKPPTYLRLPFFGNSFLFQSSIQDLFSQALLKKYAGIAQSYTFRIEAATGICVVKAGETAAETTQQATVISEETGSEKVQELFPMSFHSTVHGRKASVSKTNGEEVQESRGEHVMTVANRVVFVLPPLASEQQQTPQTAASASTASTASSAVNSNQNNNVNNNAAPTSSLFARSSSSTSSTAGTTATTTSGNTASSSSSAGESVERAKTLFRKRTSTASSTTADSSSPPPVQPQEAQQASTSTSTGMSSTKRSPLSIPSFQADTSSPPAGNVPIEGSGFHMKKPAAEDKWLSITSPSGSLSLPAFVAADGQVSAHEGSYELSFTYPSLWQYLSKELQVLCEVNQQVYDITNLFKEHVPTVPQDANLQHVVALLEQVIGDYEVVGEVAADGQQTTPGRAISEGSVSEILARFLLQQSSTAANHVLPQHTSHVLLSNIKQQRERIAFTLNNLLVNTSYSITIKFVVNMIGDRSNVATEQCDVTNRIYDVAALSEKQISTLSLCQVQQVLAWDHIQVQPVAIPSK